MLLRKLTLSIVLLSAGIAFGAEHSVLLQGNDRLVILASDGKVQWERPWGPIHDCHLLPNGNIMVLEGRAKVSEINRESKEVVWTFDAAMIDGKHDKGVEVHACQPLENGNVMIAISGRAEIVEVNRDGKILKTVPLKVEHPHPHTDTRLARKLDNGNYLVCHEGDGVVREYDGNSSEVVWEYEVPLFGKQPAPGHGPEAFGNKAFCALRLPSGNTLISTGNGHSVIEVTPDKKVVWEIHQRDLPNITLAWVTTLEVLDNGNFVIGNCHAGPGNPLLVEIDPKTKKVVWTLDRFDDFGNSVSNSAIVDAAGSSIR